MSHHSDDDGSSSGDESSNEETREARQQQSLLDGIEHESKRKEVAVPFTGLSSLKTQWESGSVTSEAGPQDVKADTKDELYKLRQRICLGRSASMRQVYEKGVSFDSAQLRAQNGNNKSDTVVIGSRLKAVFIKEQFEKGQLDNGNDMEETRLEGIKREKLEDLSVVAEAETASRDAKTMFKQIDASHQLISRSPQPPSPAHQNGGLARSSTTGSFRVPAGQNSQPLVAANPSEIIRCTDPGAKEEVVLDNTKLRERYKFFEDFKDSPKEPKRFEMTPPREAAKEDTPEPAQNGHRDPNVVRSSDLIDDLPKSDTTKKMLGKFKQLESQTSVDGGGVGSAPGAGGPKPLKRITPPRELNGNGVIDRNGKDVSPDRDPNIG